MTSLKYLQPRGKAGIYQLRFPVPRSLHAQFGRLRVLTMGTSDPAIAEDRARPYITKWKAEFRQALARPTAKAEVRERTPSLAMLEELAVIVGHDNALEEMGEGRRTLRRAAPAIWDANVRWYEAERKERARDVATGNTGAAEELADLALGALGLKLPKGNPLYDQFCQLLNQENFAALTLATRHNAGDIHAVTESRLAKRVQEERAKQAEPGETLIELFERYAAQRLAEKRKRPDTIKQDRKVIASFAGFVGEGRKVCTITGDDVRDWIDALAVLPPNYRKMKAYYGLDVRAAAEKARGEGANGPSLTTLNKYLSTVSPLFTWLKKRNYHQGTNPCDGLFNDVPKGSNPRPPFTTDQLNKILSSPLFTGFEAVGKEHLPGGNRADDWRYWVPLVCMFTGARLGEIAQLRIEDVREEKGVWFIHIRDDETTGQTTKSKKSRAAPVHSKLAALGFLDFHKREVERAKRNGNAAMFPELHKNERDQISGKVSRFWRSHLAKIGVKDGSDGFGAHSFRHTLADRMREEAELRDDQIAIALGHNQKTTTSGYGRLQHGTVTMLREMFEGVRFEGVDFSKLA